MTALELQGVSVSLAGRRVLEDVSLAVARGSVTALVGGNGAGKTTLLRAALGLTAHEGRCLIFGEAVEGLSPAGRASRVGYLAQERRIAWGMTARRIAALGAGRLSPKQADAAAEAALERVGATALAERSVFDMSGGERARVLLARLLATRAPLLVLDEPVAGLDPDAQLATLDLLRREADEGRAVLLTLHDLSLAARYCDRAVALQAGRVLSQGAPLEALSPEVLRAGFGLDAAWVQTEAGPLLSARRSRTGP